MKSYSCGTKPKRRGKGMIQREDIIASAARSVAVNATPGGAVSVLAANGVSLPTLIQVATLALVAVQVVYWVGRCIQFFKGWKR